ncbi:MAG: 30S ribosomal protein S16 [Sphingobacteriales bacterium]|jgi:small subunit ribosomal protein S16|nr:MAG: 30S ribosomal protein S16 [Sphingobacteriales bacterium]
MATRLRLQRHGSKGQPFYKIVAADSRAKRDGRFIEQIGTYNPTSIPATINLDIDKAVKWMQAGAEPSDTVKAILKYKGAAYKNHLLRGVKLGLFGADEVEAKFNAWLDGKEGKVAAHKAKADADKKAKHDIAVKAKGKVKKVVEEEVAENTEEVENTATEEVVENVSTENNETPAENAE